MSLGKLRNSLVIKFSIINLFYELYIHIFCIIEIFIKYPLQNKGIMVMVSMEFEDEEEIEEIKKKAKELGEKSKKASSLLKEALFL